MSFTEDLNKAQRKGPKVKTYKSPDLNGIDTESVSDGQHRKCEMHGPKQYSFKNIQSKHA